MISENLKNRCRCQEGAFIFPKKIFIHELFEGHIDTVLSAVNIPQKIIRSAFKTIPNRNVSVYEVID